ncbi:MAG: hypothetical protein LBE24_07810 [Methylobacillus sp.]|jgi:hypothetical protein|nr:hypothetical protein [Methylobacillus sp.]
MDTIFRLYFEYFWLAVLALLAFQYVQARRALSAQEAEDAQAHEVGFFQKLYIIWFGLPFVIMGAGKLTGYTPIVWHYFRPQDLNPFVLAFHIVLLVEICALTWWVFCAGGAEKIRDLGIFVVDAPGRPGKPVSSLIGIKLFVATGALLYPILLYLIISSDFPDYF